MATKLPGIVGRPAGACIPAVALVVSEETGEISLAVEGRLVRELGRDSLRSTLHRALLGEMQEREQVA